MADQGQGPKKPEYDQYAPQTSGRLFSNAMFGFNKEEVLEYLEELADENYQRQDAAEQRIRDLDLQIKNLEARADAHAAEKEPDAQPDEALEESHRQLNEMANSLSVAYAAAQQAEEEVAELKEKLFTSQKESNWLREEHQKTDKLVAELRRQLDDASQGQWFGAEEQIAELRRQLDETIAERDAAEAERDAAEAERDAAEAERDAIEAEREAADAEREAEAAYAAESPAGQTAAAMIREAEEEAQRIREGAYAERDRLHRQILNSAGGLAESVGSLREDITTVEGDVSAVLENVQEALAELLLALGHTEQNLATLGLQAERFPSSATAVGRQPALYFQPGPELGAERERASRREQPPRPAPNAPEKQKLERRHSSGRRSADLGKTVVLGSPGQSYGGGGFRRVWPDGAQDKAQPFRATFSNSPTATGAYMGQAATAPPLPRESYDEDYEYAEETREDRMRDLTETLVDTLRQMIEE